MSDPLSERGYSSVSQQLGTVLASNEFLKVQVAEMRADLRRNEDSSRALQRDVADLAAAMSSLSRQVAGLAEPVNQYVTSRARISSFAMFIGGIALVVGVLFGPVWPDVLRKLFPWLTR